MKLSGQTNKLKYFETCDQIVIWWGHKLMIFIVIANSKIV